MRITPYIALLFAATSAFAQSSEPTKLISQGLEPHKGYVIPTSSFNSTDGENSLRARYAITVDEWTAQAEGSSMRFDANFAPPFSWIGRQIFLSVGASSAPYKVFVGDKEVGCCFNPAMPAQFNVTRCFKRDAKSGISIVMERDARVEELESWTHETDLALGEVVMLSQPVLYVRDVAVQASPSVGGVNAAISINVKSESLNARQSRINYELLTPDDQVVSKGFSDITLEMKQSDEISIFTFIPDSLAWSAENPKLYTLRVSTQYRGRFVEYQTFEIGLRSIEMSDNGEMSINGNAVQLNAVEVPSTVGVAQLSEFKKQGYNTVVIGAGEYDKAIYDYADSVGLYLIATAPINSSKSGGSILPGGNPTNDPSRVGEYLERVDAIFNQTKRHPSVIAYSLAEGSLNGNNLYEGYLYLKSREKYRPIIYRDGGDQWNNDPLKLEF